MSHTTASSLNNRVVSFVNTVDNDYNCVICMQVADDPVRCSAFCAALFCKGCMKQALADKKKKICPTCMKSTQVNPIDVFTRNQILKHDVYCVNKDNDQSDDIDQHTSTDSRKRKAGPDDDKCIWIGKYDQLPAHLNQCDYEMVKCVNNGCKDMVERRALEAHHQGCVHRTEPCKTCNLKILWSAMTEHQENKCQLALVTCEVIGCNAVMMRKYYKKHQDEAAKQHIRLLSAALSKASTALIEAEQKNSMQVNWRVTDVAAKLQEAAVDKKCYGSPRFNVFFRGSHKLYIQARIQGNTLGLYLCKDVGPFDDKSRLGVGGTSFTVKKAGLPDDKGTISPDMFLEPPGWGWGWSTFLSDFTRYIDNDTIYITVNLNLNKDHTIVVL